jgi:hypothetical protein
MANLDIQYSGPFTSPLTSPSVIRSSLNNKFGEVDEKCSKDGAGQSVTSDDNAEILERSTSALESIAASLGAGRSVTSDDNAEILERSTSALESIAASLAEITDLLRTHYVVAEQK